MDVPLKKTVDAHPYVLEGRLIDSPIREFSEFCRQRLEGLALTVDRDTLALYRQAREKGERILGEMEEKP